MNTPPIPPGNLPVSPTIPLSDDLRTAYETLRDALEAQYQGTADLTVRSAILPQLNNVKNILTKDSMYKIAKDDAIYQALLTQINATNDGLKTLQTQMAATASHFQMADNIVSSIAKVFSLLGVL